jgi:phage-related protein
MELSADARKRILEFYRKAGVFVLGVEKLAKERGENSPEVQGYAIARINELLAVIRSAGIMLNNLPAALKARAEASGLAQAEIAKIESRAGEAIESLQNSMGNFRSLLENIKYALQNNRYPHPLIGTLKLYVALSPDLMKSRIDHLVQGVESAEAMVYEAAEKA